MELELFLQKLASVQSRLRIPLSLVSNFPGEHPSKHKILESEISDRRPYFPGDDLKYIDWKQYARSGRYYVKQAYSSSRSRVSIVLDNSRSMFIPPEKFSQAALLALAMGWHGLRLRDLVGFGLSQEGRPPSPLQSPSSFYTLYKKTMELTAGGSGDEEALLETISRLPNRRFVIIVSDLMFSDVLLQKIIHRLQQKKALALFIHSLSFTEISGAEIYGWQRLVDSEKGTTLAVSDTGLSHLKENIYQSIQRRKESILRSKNRYFLYKSEESFLSSLLFLLNQA